MPGKLKSIRTKVERARSFSGCAQSRDGFYPRVFDIWTGASWSAGVGYRRHVLDDRALVDAATEFSIRGYRLFQTSLEFPALPHRLYFRGDARYRHFPQEDFSARRARESRCARRTASNREVWRRLGSACGRGRPPASSSGGCT
jgi:hypothetical protein